MIKSRLAAACLCASMESDDDVPLILTWDEANSGLLNEEAERGDESKFLLSYPQRRPVTWGCAILRKYLISIICSGVTIAT